MGIKKYAMIIVWRTQQVAQISSLIMLALTLTLQVNLYIEWRFSNTYIGALITLSILAAILLIAGYAWDKKLKMWREQVQVSVERNPYTTTKMTPKEIISYETIYIPILELMAELAKTKKKREEFAETAKAYQRWITHEKQDPETGKNYKWLRKWLKLPEWSV